MNIVIKDILKTAAVCAIMGAFVIIGMNATFEGKFASIEGKFASIEDRLERIENILIEKIARK